MLPSIHKGGSDAAHFVGGLYSKQEMAAHGLDQADMDCLEESVSRSNSMTKELSPSPHLSFAPESYGGEDLRFSGSSPRSTSERLSRFSQSRPGPPSLRPMPADALPAPLPNGQPTILVLSPNLPPKMHRLNGQAWKMGDYNILQKMYTGKSTTP